MSNKLRTIIQDTWTDEDDKELYNYMTANKIKYEQLSEEEILKLDPKDINVLFCNTQILQKLLKNNNVDHKIETYPDFFEKQYKRTIKKTQVKNLSIANMPFFVKPLENNKGFNGRVVEDVYDYNYYRSQVDLEDNIYVSSVVNFVNEYRLFISNGKCVGIVESSQHILNDDDIISKTPDEKFVQEVVDNCKYKYCIVDIGMFKDGEWSVVEVNPPYSITSYDYPIDKYYEYCQNAWNYIKVN